MSEPLKLTAYSTAMFSTWVFVEPMRLLLDAGDGVCAGLLQKSRKIDTVAVTHADRDHITGLLQLQQLNAHDGKPRILYPKDCGSFPALAEFVSRFDPGTGPQLTWTPVSPGDAIAITKDLKLQVLASQHFTDAGDKIKSVSYRVVRESRKLKEEHRSKMPAELQAFAAQHGSDALSESRAVPLLGYSGDTRECNPEHWRGCEVLIHETTFLSRADAESSVARHNEHSFLPDVLAKLKDAPPPALILMHFSSRYNADEIRTAVRACAKDIGYTGTMYVIPPCEIVRDVLGTTPAWP